MLQEDKAKETQIKEVTQGHKASRVPHQDLKWSFLPLVYAILLSILTVFNSNIMWVTNANYICNFKLNSSHNFFFKELGEIDFRNILLNLKYKNYYFNTQ